MSHIGKDRKNYKHMSYLYQYLKLTKSEVDKDWIYNKVYIKLRKTDRINKILNMFKV
jgi:hypothetical protein